MALGAAVTLVFSLACIRWVAPFGLMDHPDPRKQHRAPTARTAGLTLWLLILAVLAAGRCPFPIDRTEWLVIHAMALMGLLDDWLNIRARYKAILGLALGLLLALEIAPDLAPLAPEFQFLGLAIPSQPVWTVPLLTLWFWFIPQAFNLIDGLNGLSIGFSLVLLSVLAWAIGYAPAGGYLSGGLVATLLLNYPRARHFLGDCGSLMLGSLFSVMAVKAFVATNADLLLWVFAYPILDVCLVVAVRKWKGVSLGTADRSHLHHYLVDRLGHQRVWLVPLVLIALAFLPMCRAMGFYGHQFISLLGLATLIMLALQAFRDRTNPTRVPKPLKTLASLTQASESNEVA